MCKFLGEIDNLKEFSKDGLSEYFSDTWNIQDILFFMITCVIVVLRVNYANDIPEPDVEDAPMHTLVALPIDLYAVLVVMKCARRAVNRAFVHAHTHTHTHAHTYPLPS